ncbi:hypothetical protein FA10DRAFT_260338 [Acaromyces ingoldii]|uniref:Uncharacterized protein n=1 Tax=Acaromyces ingoldii TaxID=215250 RepID=A0A316YMB9_9BASI|nr:hypothetical protein FA10DRAFT_260338 [Acaromyces ingoldii]PWN90517.1 hypothetical protein FA10DRAFT_260338 [Acaromyces ingoldii]
MRLVSLLFLGAGLLPSHTFQHPKRNGKEALPPEQPKKHLRLFGTNVYVDHPLEAPRASGITSTRPSSRRLEYLPHEQGTSRSMGPRAKGTLVAKYTSSAAQEQSSFMPGASRVAPPQPLRQQGSRMRPFKEVEAENVLDDLVREEATRNRLMMISLDIAQWKFERELVRKYGVREEVISEQLRWFMTAEEIQSKDDQEKIAKLSKDASPEYQSKYKKLKSKDQQGAPSASDIMQSDRFIPPSPNPGAKVYRTPSQSDVVGKKFEFKGSHIPS